MKTKMMKFEFTKVFTNRSVFAKGTTFKDDMTFLSLSDFIAWVSDINAANAKGKVPYKVEV